MIINLHYKDHDEMRARIQDDLRRAYRRETGSRRYVSPWTLNNTGWSKDGRTSYYEATIVGLRDRSGANPILGKALVILGGS